MENAGIICSRTCRYLERNAPVIKASVIYLLTAAVTAGAPIVLLPFLTRILTPEEYGKLAMFSATVQLFGIATGLSTHGAVAMKYFDRDIIDFPRFVSSCLILLLASTALTLLATWIILEPLERLTRLPGTWLFIAVIFSASCFIVQVQLSIWQSSKSAAKFGALRAFQGTVELSSSVVLVFMLGLSWQGRVAGIVLGGLAASACALVSLFRGRWLRLPRDTSYMRNALRFGLPLLPHATGGMLIMFSDRLLITSLLNVSLTGIYLVASQLGMVLYLANDALNRAYSPLLIETLKHNDLHRDRNVVRLTYVYFAVLIFVALLFAAVVPTLLATLVGQKFQAAGSIFIFIAVGQAFSGMYLMVATYIFYAERTAYLAILTIIAGTLNLVITYWMISLHGLIGAAEGFLTTQILFFFGAWALAQRCRPMPWFSAIAFDATSYAKAATTGLAMFAYASIFIAPNKWVLSTKTTTVKQSESHYLVAASFAGNLELITKLLIEGADVDSSNEEGVTALIAASSSSHRAAVELLLSYGANPLLRTKEGYSAYDFAKNQSNGELANLLISRDGLR
ncbi:oligosaccharide flippase family protein [Bradyrhizobium sp. LLZ17]|uniref:Oligosaccharide flippase family protein n=1 Tax=Bradyrhizobium sp. LLZ17 TaxID=3239388 RepID=A0AB39XLW6_9BRAD